MRVWGSIFNFFGALILFFLVVPQIVGIREDNEDFEELKLRYAVDYATEGAFYSSIDTGDLGNGYIDLADAQLNPNFVLPVFKSIICLNYDIIPSELAFSTLDKYIPFASLIVKDGYYMASLQEVDTTLDGVNGNEYNLVWSLKKPYTFNYTNKCVAVNLINDSWILVEKVGTSIVTTKSTGLANLVVESGIILSRDTILSSINKKITKDINVSVRNRNAIYNLRDDNYILLPNSQTVDGVNSIDNPMLLIALDGSPFGGVTKAVSMSVGGYKVSKSTKILGFTEGGLKYYCYEGQLPSSLTSSITEFFSTQAEAALAGYVPSLKYMQ